MALQVYFPVLLAPLLRTLLHLTAAPFGPAPQVLISYQMRSLPKETPFWNAFGLWFSFVPVLVRRRVPPTTSEDAVLDGPWRRFGGEEAFVFVARRRPESVGWTVPESDGALLGGAGAQGSDSYKSDDTFELLLMMGLDDMINDAV